ncbi:beta propeller repeat protein [Paenibacillus tuaregi]|uniref:hypothetical protein n=1 Tax=Paenibacillus tuaregi TaxID=1816681 RepID=UPI000838AECE|nr:hypothetical protein [Paenibacillus tuaregi]
MAKRTFRSALLAAALALTWGLGTSAPAQGTVAEAASSAPCQTGDHGLLQKLQKQHASKTLDPLHITDVNFLSDTTGRAAGNGFLIGTSNGGCNWQEIYTGQWQFDQIVFPNNVTGFALARTSPEAAAKLIATSDGGSHWKVLNTSGQVFKKMDAQDGQYIIGYTSNGAYKSSNGGTSWTKIKTPANTRAAVFTDKSALKGFTLTVHPGVGYKLHKTVNGGTSWATVLTIPSGTAFGGELYAEGSQVWALAYGESGMSQVSYSLYASHDGGVHWKRIIAQSTAGGGPAPGTGPALVKKGPASPGGHPGNMQLIGSSAAYLAGGSPAGGKVGVGRSLDGGKSWSNVPAVLPGFDARISFPSIKTGWLAVTNASNTAVYVTHDGGVSWNKKFSLPDA